MTTLRARWIRHSGPVPTPFLALYKAPPSFTLPSKLQQEVPGLLACEVIACGKLSLLSTTWESNTHYTGNESVLLSKLGGAAGVRLMMSGSLRQFQPATPKLTWMERIKKHWGLIATGIAILSTLEVARNHHEWLFVYPRLAAVESGRQWDLLASQSSSHKFALRNQSRGANSFVGIDRVTLTSKADPQKPIPVDIADGMQFPRIMPGDAAETTVRIPALSRGEYTLFVAGRQEAGLFWKMFSTGDFQEQAGTFKVWPKLELVRRRVNPTPDRERAMLILEFEVGVDCKGLEGTVALEDSRVRIHEVVNNVYPKDPKLYATGAPQGWSGQRWQTSNVRAFSIKSVRVDLRSSAPLTADEWQEFLNEKKLIVYQDCL